MTIAPQSSPQLRTLPACISALLVAAAAPLPAQDPVPLAATAAFHAEPDGARLGELQAGFRVVPGEERGGWREVTFDVWIWGQSTGPTTRDGFNAIVTSDGGENLRREPNGPVVGRALRGALLQRIGRQGDWIRVTRTVWVPATSVRTARVITADPPPPAPVSRPAEEPVRERVLIPSGTEVAAGPGVDPTVRAPADLAGEVLERNGNWVKIRAEVWVRRDDVRPLAPDSAVSPTVAQLTNEPERWLGREVAWRLQFLAVRTADELRPELPAGRPYVLARGPLPEAGFVYVALSTDQAGRFRAMEPLTEFLARGRLVATRTRYLPIPVLELLEAP